MLVYDFYFKWKIITWFSLRWNNFSMKSFSMKHIWWKEKDPIKNHFHAVRGSDHAYMCPVCFQHKLMKKCHACKAGIVGFGFEINKNFFHFTCFKCSRVSLTNSIESTRTVKLVLWTRINMNFSVLSKWIQKKFTSTMVIMFAMIVIKSR